MFEYKLSGSAGRFSFATLSRALNGSGLNWVRKGAETNGQAEIIKCKGADFHLHMQIDVRSGRQNVFRQQRYFFPGTHRILFFEMKPMPSDWSKLDRSLQITSKVARFVNSLGECFDGRVEFEICLLNEPRGRAPKRSCSSSWHDNLCK